MEPRDRGFTLIEMLIVVVILGFLAAIAIPRYMRAREKSYIATVTSDLKNLATQQEIYQSDHQVYAATISDLTNYTVSAGVTVSVNEATGTGWAATATHAGFAGGQCGIYYGGASAANGTPAAQPGAVTCQN